MEPFAPPLLAECIRRLEALRFDGPGTVVALFSCPCPDQHVPVKTLRVIPGVGADGDYPGKQWWQGRRVPGRQVSCVSAEVLDALEIEYSVVGDNLVVRGINLAALAPGDVLRVGNALLSVTPTPHRPCAKLAARSSLAKMQAIAQTGCRGVLMDAVREAAISVGDSVERMA